MATSRIYSDYLKVLNIGNKPIFDFLKSTPRPFDKKLRDATYINNGSLRAPLEKTLQESIDILKSVASIQFPVSDHVIVQVAAAYRKAVAAFHLEVIAMTGTQLTPEQEQIIRAAERNLVFNLYHAAGLTSDTTDKKRIIFFNDIMSMVFHHDDANIVAELKNYYQNWILRNSSNPQKLVESIDAFGVKNFVDAVRELAGKRENVIKDIINIVNLSRATFSDQSQADNLFKLLDEAKQPVVQEIKRVWSKPILPDNVSNVRVETIPAPICSDTVTVLKQNSDLVKKTSSRRLRAFDLRAQVVPDDFSVRLRIIGDMAALAEDIINRFNVPTNIFSVLAKTFKTRSIESIKHETQDELLSLSVIFMRDIHNEISTIKDAGILNNCQFMLEKLKGIFSQQQTTTKDIKSLIDELMQKYCANNNTLSLAN